MADPSKLLVAAITMAIDRMTLEVIAALNARDVECLLFKGPVFADWLYDPGETRFYGDSDLLVAAPDVAHARTVLRELGFAPAAEPGHVVPGKPELHAWQRADRWVDLQYEIPGIRADAREQWAAIWAERERWVVAGEPVWTFGPAARGLLLAAHAAHHGARSAHPLEDLRRGLARLPDELWLQAWELACRLDGADAFAAGLGLLPAGERLMGRLGIDVAVARRVRLRASGASHLALSLDDLFKTPGLRARLLIVRSEIAPSADFLRWWLPLARRGPAALLAVRMWRPVWLVTQLPGALWAWGRAAVAGRRRHRRRS